MRSTASRFWYGTATVVYTILLTYLIMYINTTDDYTGVRMVTYSVIIMFATITSILYVARVSEINNNKYDKLMFVLTMLIICLAIFMTSNVIMVLITLLYMLSLACFYERVKLHNFIYIAMFMSGILIGYLTYSSISDCLFELTAISVVIGTMLVNGD